MMSAEGIVSGKVTELLKFIKSSEKHNSDAQFQAMQERAKTQSEKIGVVLDKDETLANTVKYWVDMINFYMRNHVLTNKEDHVKLPSYEELCAAGGTDAFYPKFFTEQLGEEEGKKLYLAFMERMRHRTLPNYSPEIMEEALTAAINEIITADNEVGLLGYMTARPGTGSVVAASRKQMADYGLPADLPIVARPVDLDIKQTGPWKIEHLEKLQKVSGKVIVIIDDSAGLANQIRQRNQNRGEKALLIQIIYPGPLTKPKIEKGEVVADHANGLYISNWQSMSETLQLVRKNVLGEAVSEQQS